MVIAFLIPLTTIIVLYGLILWHTTETNPRQQNNLLAKKNKRNLKVFHNILILLAIVTVGGTPYLLCIIINKIAQSPWPLYSISVLFIALSAAVESVTIFVTNKRIQTIFFVKIGFRKAELERTLTRTSTRY